MNETSYQIDLLKAINQNLNARDRMYRMICDMADGAFLYFDLSKNEVVTIGNWSQYFDFEILEKKDLEKLYDMVDESYVIPLRELVNLEKSGLEEQSLECLTKKDKNWFKFQTCISYDRQGNPTDKVIGIMNVTKYKLQAEELNFYSFYDVITGLYNRNYFIRLLGEWIQKAKSVNEVISVLMIDIDDFHKINDGLGMVYGDELIHQFGTVLKELCTDENVIACHLNSDIYCIAIYAPKGDVSPEGIYAGMKQQLSKPFWLGGKQKANITVTVGVANYPEAANTALELINCAEIVMIKGKTNGKDDFLYFDKPILNEFMTGLELETNLKTALSHHDFELYYQPQYYAGNKKLRGMEALIRWRGKDNQMISPAVFIPIAEKNGDIIPIGNWVVEEAIRQFAYWQNLYHCNFIMSINVSAMQYNQEDFVDRLLEVLKKYNVYPDQIELEMTESILIENFDVICEKMQILQNKGVRISLDDFGTGFSSLSYLKKLPINTLKIDKSFIDTVLSDSATRIITESIVNMVKSLGFESIAEGVEQEPQYRYLHAIGCDVIQGYLFGKPMAADEVEKMLRSQTER